MSASRLEWWSANHGRANADNGSARLANLPGEEHRTGLSASIFSKLSRCIRLSCLVAVLIATLSTPGQRTSEHGRPGNSWAEYGGGADSAQYSDLSQINRDNVKRLRVVWRYSTGDSREYLFNPIVVHGVMYVLAKRNSIVALDAKTGKELGYTKPIPTPP